MYQDYVRSCPTDETTAVPEVEESWRVWELGSYCTAAGDV